MLSKNHPCLLKKELSYAPDLTTNWMNICPDWKVRLTRRDGQKIDGKKYEILLIIKLLIGASVKYRNINVFFFTVGNGKASFLYDASP